MAIGCEIGTAEGLRRQVGVTVQARLWSDMPPRSVSRTFVLMPPDRSYRVG